MFETGAVYRYAYLWAREKEQGEESGRKERPACLLLRPPQFPEALIMLPITGTSPSGQQTADLIPEVECRRLGLRSPAWIILDEYNVAAEHELYDFASLDPLGKFSDAYQRHLRGIVRSLIEARAIKGVRRN